jgi:hypothetical protein
MDLYDIIFAPGFINFRMIVVVFRVKFMNNNSCSLNGESRMYIYLSIRGFFSKYGSKSTTLLFRL